MLFNNVSFFGFGITGNLTSVLGNSGTGLFAINDHLQVILQAIQFAIDVNGCPGIAKKDHLKVRPVGLYIIIFRYISLIVQ